MVAHIGAIVSGATATTLLMATWLYAMPILAPALVVPSEHAWVHILSGMCMFGLFYNKAIQETKK